MWMLVFCVVKKSLLTSPCTLHQKSQIYMGLKTKSLWRPWPRNTHRHTLLLFLRGAALNTHFPPPLQPLSCPVIQPLGGGAGRAEPHQRRLSDLSRAAQKQRLLFIIIVHIQKTKLYYTDEDCCQIVLFCMCAVKCVLPERPGVSLPSSG